MAEEAKAVERVVMGAAEVLASAVRIFEDKGSIRGVMTSVSDKCFSLTSHRNLCTRKLMPLEGRDRDCLYKDYIIFRPVDGEHKLLWRRLQIFRGSPPEHPPSRENPQEIIPLSGFPVINPCMFVCDTASAAEYLNVTALNSFGPEVGSRSEYYTGQTVKLIMGRVNKLLSANQFGMPNFEKFMFLRNFDTENGLL
ncbi:hypothetical protein Tco_0269005 [Tanacetum coccineum]